MRLIRDASMAEVLWQVKPGFLARVTGKWADRYGEAMLVIEC